jgi:hypothetical protein
MSELHRFSHMVSTAPKSDVAVLLITFSSNRVWGLGDCSEYRRTVGVLAFYEAYV